MNSFALYLLALFLLSVLITVPALEIGVALLVDPEKSVGTQALNGCNWWPYSVVVSMIVGGLAWSAHGWWALAAAPLGPVVMVVAASVVLRLTHRDARDQEFYLRQGHAVAIEGDQALAPAYFLKQSNYYNTGPASGYCVNNIILCGHSGAALATNNYLGDEEFEGDCRALVDQVGIPTLDVVVTMDTEEPDTAEIFVIRGNLLGLLFGRRQSLDPQIFKWWERLFIPNLGEEEALEGSGRLVATQVRALLALNPEPELKAELTALLDFLARAKSDVAMMRYDSYSSPYGRITSFTRL